MGKLFIARHGETDFNVQGRYAGSVDIELNARGQEQARELAKELSNCNVDFIITSPLRRCQQTTEIIGEIIKAPIIAMDEFRERGVGVFEGLTREEAETQHPELWAKKITRSYDSAPTNGETIKEVEDRVFAGLKKIKEGYWDKDVLIVTHAFVGKVIHKFFYELTEDQFFTYKLDNAKIVGYDFVN